MDEAYDIVVVGAGWFGLAAAKAASQLMPDKTLAVLESAESCGGTWSQNRLYPGLKSNNMLGTYEYPDFPMSEDRYGVPPDTHIPGAVLHRYLTDFARHFGFFDRIQFHNRVQVVEPAGDNTWRLTVSGPDGGKPRTVIARQLILATGLTSTPNMPTYKGAADLGAPIFHAKDFCARAPELAKTEIKNAMVVGGAKSAYDVAYALVQDHAGATVDLVVRDNGHGPVWIAPSRVTPFKARLDQLLLIRWMTWMAPCPWGGEDGFGRVRRLLHGTAIGRMLVDLFWRVLSADVVAANGYDAHPAVRKLKPWNSAFWIGSGLSILNYETPFFDLVKEGRIRVHIGQIDHMERNTVVLADGTRLPTDLVVCSTGWRKESPIRFDSLGPHKFGLDVPDAELAKLNVKADEDVLRMFPRLRNQPQLRFTPPTGEPLRLYRFMVPSSHVAARSIAFAGAVSSINTAVCATAQGHWIAAFLSGRLDRLASTPDEISDEIMLHTQWGRWRYPCGYGASLPDFVFEGLPYVDMLLRDLGLENNRKKGWFAEMTTPYLPKDFKGLVEEWKASHDEAETTA
ncbi:Flavin monooxygenase-like protein [Cordyceps fumosorosea ARSEF 2679]|uniref:Flavin monooxygenase-like protein n=1 Tax=Cordyceps fumosorosea (strain ARSEF 2679) TaxID=1081104 RepID=A0A167WNS0_CORFA|nr:Flavin monooxygenase-like protein [Cordyceps fumosorosea ARSEF 2679]OAA64023.1 Flavin monooxygenase-like protein [Cordyceps fumosorosea ARSEF 2679]